MNCLLCKTKQCKSDGKDCNGQRDAVISLYKDNNLGELYVQADELVAHGRAGQLSRLEEIVALVKGYGYQKISIAYCFCMEDLAEEVKAYLIAAGLKVTAVRCTVNGIRENQIADSLGEGVNCNPVGQAEAINNSDAEFVVDMGLCMGHDVMFRQHLKKPATTFIVKDRVYHHNPALALQKHSDANADFLTKHLDEKFGMRSRDWLRAQIESQSDVIILDVRASKGFEQGHIEGSINIPLKQLPVQYRDQLPERSATIICVCNGSIQAAYASMFLYSRGYHNVYSLSGGYSGWKKEA
jgi:uncharacterized metal-binding protein/rhodanese-related sulfurtransferase